VRPLSKQSVLLRYILVEFNLAPYLDWHGSSECVTTASHVRIRMWVFLYDLFTGNSTICHITAELGSCCNGHLSSQWEQPIFWGPPIKLKSDTVDYVREGKLKNWVTAELLGTSSHMSEIMGVFRGRARGPTLIALGNL